MAVIWQKKQAGQHYEVRKAGHSRRLYKNGVCHSQYNPHSILTGSIWDLLVLPALYQPDCKLRRVLVLGVGGGAVIRQLNALLQPEQIIGVEKDPVHLHIARRFFDLDAGNIELIEADAVDWLSTCKRKKFDLIIEDIFIEQRGRPMRAIDAGEEWCSVLAQRLSVRGTLVMNFASADEFRLSAVYRDMALRDRFASIFRLTAPALDNHVVAMHRVEISQRDIHRNIMAHPEPERAICSGKLKYRSSKLRQTVKAE